MFEFKSIELMNWDFWPHFELPFDERIIMLAGPNGSGKTTFLDSLRLLLGAKTLSTGRKLSKYLRSGDKVAMVKGVVTNPLRHGKRPFRHHGITDDEATLVCLLENRAGSWEKRFAILPGNAAPDVIRAQEKWMGPEEYGRSLQTAGLPRTLLKILALEQGETNKLCEKSAAELLRYLLEIQGDKQTLDRYTEALENYRASEKELYVQDQKSLAMEHNLLEHQSKADEARRYEASVGELARLRTDVLPRAVYKDVRARAQNLQSLIGEEENKLRAIKDGHAALDDEISRLIGEDAAALSEIAVIRQTSQHLLREKSEYDQEYGALVREVAGLEKLREEVASIQPEDGEALAAKLEEARRASARHANEFDEAHEKVLGLLEESRELESKKGVAFPREVADVRTALQAEGIEHSLVAEMVDVRDPAWQLAIESALGPSRFAVVVDAKDSLRAREIARARRYRYFVTEFEPVTVQRRPERGTALAMTELARDDMPSWVVDNLAHVYLVEDVAQGMKLGRDRTSITRDGYKQDRRGGVYVGVDRLYCGRSAAGERARVIREHELPEATGRRDRLAREREGAERLIQDLTGRLTRQRKLAEWREKEALLALKAERREELTRVRRSMTEKIIENDGRIKVFEDARSERAVRRGELLARRERLDQERAALERELPAQRSKAMAELEEMRRVEETLAPEARTPEALSQVPSRETAESLIRRLDDEVTNWTGCRDQAAREIFEKIKAEYDEFRGFLDARRREHARWSEELSLARRSYRRVVEQTVEFYRRSVVKLAEKAGFQIEVPALDLSDDDEALERAGLVIRVAYDGKHFVNIDDPDLSGGQSVLTSLVLLMGMTLADGHEETGGFFILDEPFAHLSVERIDDVAAFLSATKSQFILTTPTTHNHNVFNPAHLTVALRKKKPGSVEAPAPVFIRK